MANRFNLPGILSDFLCFFFRSEKENRKFYQNCDKFRYSFWLYAFFHVQDIFNFYLLVKHIWHFELDSLTYIDSPTIWRSPRMLGWDQSENTVRLAAFIFSRLRFEIIFMKSNLLFHTFIFFIILRIRGHCRWIFFYIVRLFPHFFHFFLQFLFCNNFRLTVHGMFIEWRNNIKSLSIIWQLTSQANSAFLAVS